MDDQLVVGAAVALACTVIAIRLFLMRTRLEFRARICEVLAATARRGLPLLPALEAARLDFGGARGRALARACDGLKAGDPLHEACALAGRKFFPRNSVVALAEGGGSFPAALQAAAVDSERALDMRHRGLLALAYPLVLIAVLPPLLHVGPRLVEILESFEGGTGSRALWVETTQTVTSIVLGLVVIASLAWLLFGRWLPYPGRALFRVEQSLRSGATRLRAGGDWPSMPSRLPSDLSARLNAAMRHGPTRAAEAIDSAADECARRANETAHRMMRVMQFTFLLLVGVVAAFQFATVFVIQDACLERIAPW